MFFNTGKTVLLKDENSNTLWVASAHGGMFCYNLNNKQLYSPHDQVFKTTLYETDCVGLFLLQNGQLLFADNKTKKSSFWTDKKSLIPFFSEASNPTPTWYYHADKQDKLWISCFNQNLITLDLKHNYHFDRVVHKKRSGTIPFLLNTFGMPLPMTMAVFGWAH